MSTIATHLEATSTQISWNELFTADVIALKKGQQEGHLGQWEYSTPDAPNDPVNGSSLWVDFLRDHPEYYIQNTEIELAAQASPLLSRHISQPIALAFLGPGNKFALKRKDLRAVSEFQRVSSATAYDLSPEYIAEATAELHRAYPDAVKGGHILDIFKGFEIPRGRAGKPTRVATMFGATLFNVLAQRNNDGELIVPEQSIRANLKSIRSSIGDKGFFTVTSDGNQDREKVEAAYRGQAAFAANLAHRIKRDTPYKDIDTDNVSFRADFDAASHTLCHYLTLDFGNNGGRKEYLINISPKIPDEMFVEWCGQEGFSLREKISDNGVSLYVLEAV